MTTQIQRRRGTTAQHSTFTGANGELTVDTDKEVVVVHDGTTAGGYPQMRENGSNSALALGSATTPSLKFSGDTNTGIYSPGADQVSVATGGSERLRIDAAGQIKAAGLGTAAAPAYSWIGDPNTGIYSPGADQVAISTNGTGRLFVNATGQVSVGAAPTGANTIFEVGGGTATELKIGSVSANNANFRGLRIGIQGDPTDYSGIRFQLTTGELRTEAGFATWGGFQTFYTNGLERLRIDSSGRLGLGTSSPAVPLTVFSSTNGAPAASGTTQTHGAFRISATNTSGCLDFGPNGSTPWIQATDRTDLSAKYDLLLNPNGGRVGIGTTPNSGVFEAKIPSVDTKLVIQDGVSSGNCRITSATEAYSAFKSLEISSLNTLFLTAGSERARIDSSGRLLVGTSSTSGDTRAIFQGSSSNNWAVVRLCANTTTPTDLGYLVFGDSNHVNAAWINAARDGGTWTSGASHPTRLVFSTTKDGQASPTQRMRISNLGTHFIVSEQNGVVTSTTLAAGTSDYLYLGYSAGIAGEIQSGTFRFGVSTNGNVVNSNNSYGAISDIKLKENIVDASSQWDDIKALQVRKYNFKEGQTHTQIGLIAQEVELISPGLVSESPDRDAESNELGTVTKSVNYSVLYMKAVKALQEAMERIEQLEAKVAALEAS